MVLYLQDGLGNQMFQYAFAKALQKKLYPHEKIIINTYKLDRKNSIRKYGLCHFNLGSHILDTGISAAYHNARYALSNRVVRRILKQSDYNILNEKYGMYVNVNTIYDYYEPKKSKKSFKIIKGFFQNIGFFSDVEKDLKREFTVKGRPYGNNEKILEEIQKINSVCVHIRRGDYLDPCWNHLNICNYEYYKKAMKLISEQTENPVFYIFSNTKKDVEWIQENFDFSGYKVRYVAENNPEHEDFRLMCACKHFIISNSTFSWWAQYLGRDDNKIVVAPSEWNREECQDASGMYIDSWHTVEV